MKYRDKKLEKRLQRPVETDTLLPPTPIVMRSERIAVWFGKAGEPPVLPGG
jgi:hypothetical protein